MGLLSKLFGKKPRDETVPPAPSANDAAEASDASEGETPQNGPDIAPELAPALKAFQAGRHEAALPADAIAPWYGELKGKLDEDGETQLAAWVGRLPA